MLDGDAGGARARVLAPTEQIPYGAQPVLLAETTVYGATCVEQLLLRWGPLPRPWLVLVADAPARPVADARYLVRALEGRLAGVARVPYLPVLRTVREPDEALEHKDVRAAAKKLRRTMEGN
jgi:2-C-methyl-D-erythritol 4-phosphate cytidylyltransferase